MTNLDSILKSRDITLPTNFHLVKAMVFPVVMYGCESWTVKKAELKNWCFWTVVLKTLESPLDCKEVQPVRPKGDQSWVFIGRIDAKAETPILWLPHAKSWLIGKDSDAGRDWGQEEKEGDDRGWDGWMTSPTQWTWVWVNSGSWWWTGRPGVLQSLGLQRVGHDWATELNWAELLSVYYGRFSGRSLSRQIESFWHYHELFSSGKADEMTRVWSGSVVLSKLGRDVCGWEHRSVHGVFTNTFFLIGR